ncbi:hypothetical protein BBAD15_g8781 [Beauveria bassiana D1-5]|uniref:MACPF domain-containing protein n=1 Tax=Beauveria bassiana D1-5 TaxID=1245745 RepID=A0A0A2VDI3_BEABA|nr:hypothetical protein BBAD15_g8781 [Beauveria bassiana D1-5]
MRIGVDISVLGRFPVALLFWNVAYGETVPFSNGLTLGQGYNTYLNHGCRHNAVNVSLKPDSQSPQLQIDYRAIQINKYEQLVSVLETSAGAAVKATVESGPSAGTTASFLDKSSFESSFLTYVVKVDVEKQTSSDASFALNWDNAADTSVYCDRFISHFIKGGALFARVDIKTTDSSKHKAIEQSAKAAFNAFGANVELTQSLKTSMTEIQKSSEVDMQFVYIGAPSDAQQTVSGNGSGGDAAQLVQLKTIADNFLARAKDSEWKRRAVLEKYEHVPNWSKQFQVPDYTTAKDYVISPENYIGGATTRNQVLGVINKALSDILDWVKKVTVDPASAAKLPAVTAPGEYFETFLNSLTTTKYVAQSFETASHVSTHVIEPSLRDGATKLADAEAFGFGTVAGSIKVAFGKSLQGESYVCLPDQPMAPGFKTISELWGMKKATGNFSKPVHVVPVPQVGVIRLSTEARAPAGSLFTFYTK